MRQGRVRCDVVETPALAADGSQPTDGYRDLLPWADPYIAALVAQLGASERDDRSSLHTSRFEMSDTAWLGEDDASVLDDELDSEGSHLDFPPVIGGWPLLSDVPENKAG